MIKISKCLKLFSILYALLIFYIIYYIVTHNISGNNINQFYPPNFMKIHDISGRLKTLKAEISNWEISDIKLNNDNNRDNKARTLATKPNLKIGSFDFNKDIKDDEKEDATSLPTSLSVQITSDSLAKSALIQLTSFITSISNTNHGPFDSDTGSSCQICHISLFLFLPHLKSIPASDYGMLNPRTFIRQSPSMPHKKYVIGIPSAPRQFGSYLKDTLRSIFVALSRKQLNDLKVIILLSGNESYINQEARMIENDFWKQAQIGAIEIITPPDIFYPSWSSITPTLEDTPKRMKWRTKQVLDFIYLMLYSYQKCDYYLQLEDDVIAKYNFLTIIDQVITNPATKEWAMLDFCPLGAIDFLLPA
ncbi:unnamed protein product [Gordionus sp. m RMFG-2023]